VRRNGGTEEVVAWLEREGLGTLCLTARDQEWDGAFLLGLFNESKKESSSYSSDCRGLGISLPHQIKLKGRLAILFG